MFGKIILRTNSKGNAIYMDTKDIVIISIFAAHAPRS